jgi:GMP synthase-like glutamine amidotransferase
MRRFAVIDCEDAPKWAGHERLWIDGLQRPADPPWRVYRAFAGEVPDEDVDGVVITGSHYSVLDTLPWLPRLFEYVRGAVSRHVRLVGACFGCQVIAQACGGTVARNPHGAFEIGGFEIALDPAALRGAWARPLAGRTRLRLLESHEDAVVALPPHSTCVGRSEHTPYEVFLVGADALAIQAHPELTRELIDSKILPSLVEKGRIDPDRAPEISDGMTRLDSTLVLDTIRRFLARE